jgi:hypothetical protein
LDGEKHQLDGIIMHNGKTWIGETKFSGLTDWDAPLPKGKKHPFFTGGKGDPSKSPHFTRVEEKIEQFTKYSKLATRYGMEGVAVITNNDFIWATFEQLTRHLKNVNIYSEGIDEMSKFWKSFNDMMRGVKTSSRTQKPNIGVLK